MIWIVLQGRIDAVTSAGYIEGWAYDASTPLRPLTLCVLAGGKEIARGIANRFRWDLADAGCGTGWCAFRLRVSGSVARLRRQGLSLRELAQRTEIHKTAALPLAEDQEPGLSALDEIVAGDPTVVHGIEQLRGCGAAFADFIAAEGVAQFVRAAYVYVLGRRADAIGLALYSAMIEDGSLDPYHMLKALYDSDEFREAPQHLIAPPESGFVFQIP